jgi:hypothetical protein
MTSSHMKHTNVFNKCDVCGRFTSYDNLYRRLITPDSDYSREEWETLCRQHKEEHETTQA